MRYNFQKRLGATADVKASTTRMNKHGSFVEHCTSMEASHRANLCGIVPVVFVRARGPTCLFPYVAILLHVGGAPVWHRCPCVRSWEVASNLRLGSILP